MDRLSIQNLSDSCSEAERKQSQAGGMSSGFLSLDGSMEPSKTCLTIEIQPTSGQAGTALPGTGQCFVLVPCAGGKAQVQAGSTGKGDVGSSPSSCTHQCVIWAKRPHCQVPGV